MTIENVGEVPITSFQASPAKVSVRDHDTIILGGLIYTEKDKSASGVPLLMDIPLLGYLFRSSSANNTRNELIVLIRPTVLPTPEIAALTARAETEQNAGNAEARKRCPERRIATTEGGRQARKSEILNHRRGPRESRVEPGSVEWQPKQLYPSHQSDELKGLLPYDQLGTGNPGARAFP